MHYFAKGMHFFAKGYTIFQGDTKYHKPLCKILHPHTLFKGCIILRYFGFPAIWQSRRSPEAGNRLHMTSGS